MSEDFLTGEKRKIMDELEEYLKTNKDELYKKQGKKNKKVYLYYDGEKVKEGLDFNEIIQMQDKKPFMSIYNSCIKEINFFNEKDNLITVKYNDKNEIIAIEEFTKDQNYFVANSGTIYDNDEKLLLDGIYTYNDREGKVFLNTGYNNNNQYSTVYYKDIIIKGIFYNNELFKGDFYTNYTKNQDNDTIKEENKIIEFSDEGFNKYLTIYGTKIGLERNISFRYDTKEKKMKVYNKDTNKETVLNEYEKNKIQEYFEKIKKDNTVDEDKKSPIFDSNKTLEDIICQQFNIILTSIETKTRKKQKELKEQKKMSENLQELIDSKGFVVNTLGNSVSIPE